MYCSIPARRLFHAGIVTMTRDRRKRGREEKGGKMGHTVRRADYSVKGTGFSTSAAQRRGERMSRLFSLHPRMSMLIKAADW